MKPTPKRRYYTAEEDARAEQMFAEGATVTQVAEALGRSHAAVRSRWTGLGLKQKPSREDLWWQKVARGGPDECWPWTGFVSDDNGYGQFWDGKRLVRAHRFGYEMAHGPIPDGLVIDHTCHNGSGCTDVPCEHRRCCNPAHLEATTRTINNIRGRCGDHQSSKTHCSSGHAYTPENTSIQNGHRVCRTCNSSWQAKYNAKRKKAPA